MHAQSAGAVVNCLLSGGHPVPASFTGGVWDRVSVLVLEGGNCVDSVNWIQSSFWGVNCTLACNLIYSSVSPQVEFAHM